MPKDIILSRFTGLSSELELVRALEKGDYVGHPFRGNQWATSTGASRGGDMGSSISEPVQFKVSINEDGFKFDEVGMMNFINNQHGDRKFTADESEAATFYASVFWFEDINTTLRMQGITGGSLKENSDTTTTDDDFAVIEKTINTLDNLFSKETLTDDVVVYRGVTDDDGSFRETLESEGGIMDHAYQSTSLNPIVASAAQGGGMDGAMQDGGLLMEITIPKGTHAIAVDKISGVLSQPETVALINEGTHATQDGYTFGAEILLPRGTALKVVGKRTDPELGEIWQMVAQETTA
jgi:hypothetical protein